MARPHYHCKMADIIKKTKQDKMALILLIVDGFQSLNKQKKNQPFTAEYTGVIDFLFG